MLVVDINLNTSAQTLIELKCGDAFEGQQILWRNEGRETSQRGNRVRVVSEEMIGGNYTCHDLAGRLLNHTLVLVRVERSQQQRKILDGAATAWAGGKNVADDRGMYSGAPVAKDEEMLCGTDMESLPYGDIIMGLRDGFA